MMTIEADLKTLAGTPPGRLTRSIRGWTVPTLEPDS